MTNNVIILKVYQLLFFAKFVISINNTQYTVKELLGHLKINGHLIYHSDSKLAS